MFRQLKKSLIRSPQLAELLLDSETFVRWQYKLRTGRELKLNPPESLSEKIQWLKLYWRDEVATVCADKYAVRDYVQARLGPHVLNELYAVFDRVEDIDLNNLPRSFVLKVTHGSGQNIICTEKETLDWNDASNKLRAYLKQNHYYHGREWAYKNIAPRIVCEKYLEEDGEPPKDYKFFCFDGKPHLVQVDFGRFSTHTRNLYDLNWRRLDVELKFPRANVELAKPLLFDKMLEYAARLAKGLPFVRVDFYHVHDQVYFGEMTFYPGNGMEEFRPLSYDYLLGSYLQLPDLALKNAKSS